MVAYVGHAVRRGVEQASAMFVSNGNGQARIQVEVEIPTWGKFILCGTLIVFVLVLSSLEYTLKDVVATLTMVETPSAAITISPSADSEDPDAPLEKEGLLEAGPAITLVHSRPITFHIRSTLRHLTSQAGRFARWRGLVAFIFYSFTTGLTTNFLNAIVPRIVPARLMVLSAVAAILLARVHAAWTHIVISLPSTKRFYQRIPPMSSWRQLWIPAAAKASAGYVAAYVAMGFVRISQLHNIDPNDFSGYTGMQWVTLVLRVVGLFALVTFSALFVVLPATVTLTRIEASLLPEDEETIVPFDRTFGGKVVPTILGGTGCIGFVEAWRTFNWEARRRLVKLYVKIFMIMLAITLLMGNILLVEVWAILGPQLTELLANYRRS
ncbi:hypothetical protein AOQ84DRAFT_399662 [Glonium stellatum]|uniref:Uncharacterized protein n=1 Tax=Glonium stellatum TaxID=574774 RepID=A0A8E2JPW9_9PEZI|nr:hypothetical protein AOQ84DRAFT_399662 [Glonium stellatum]